MTSLVLASLALPGLIQGKRQCPGAIVSLQSPQHFHCPQSRGLLPSGLQSISYFAWRCLFGVFLIYWFNQSLLNSKAGYFCRQKSAASPRPLLSWSLPTGPPRRDEWGWQSRLEPRNANATCHVACSPHPHPKPARAHRRTRMNVHTVKDRPQQGHLSACPSQCSLPGPSRTPH